MKNTFAKLISSLATAGILAASVTAHAAGTAAFSVSSGSTTTGSNISVAVSENGGTDVTAVTTTFTYDSSKLQLVSDNCAGGFPYLFVSNGSTVTCDVTPGNLAVSGNSEVMILSFKAVATGNASVTVNGPLPNGLEIASSGTNEWNGASASGAIAITTPVVSSTPPTQPTGGSTSTGGSTTTGTSNKQTATNNKSTTGSTNTSNKTTTTGEVKGASTTQKPSSKTAILSASTVKSGHTGLVTSTILVLALAVAGVYWFVFRKRAEETVPAKVYKLDANAKSKAKTKSTVKKKRTTATSARTNATKPKSTSRKK